MKLRNLEIKGFKSFADKTVLNFDEGITGIIGPNGCGKSNIIDAIRWVIGEQKISQLRSESLDNLIFNGSKKRGPSGLAEVSLTFENTRNLLPTEFNTVSVTRKYYRNGDSEYRLNDVNCRLKDIRDLFMDTGISTDSYAIIELGMVDDIIKDKENSRRRMLEQAAGITIYKNRKHQAQLKLDSTDHDLARIEDLLFEINNQLKSLEKQARKAKKYLEFKNDYKENSVELAKASLEGINATYSELNAKQLESATKRSELEAAIGGLEAEIEQEKTDFISREEELRLLQVAFNELNDKLRKAQEQKNLGAQKSDYLKEKTGNLQNFLKRTGEQLNGISGDIKFTGEQIEQEKDGLKELQSQLEEAGNQLKGYRQLYDEKRRALETTRLSQIQIQKDRFEVEKRVAVADSTIAGIEHSIIQLKEEQQHRRNTLERLEQERELQKKQLDEETRWLEDLKRENETLKIEAAELRKSVEEIKNQLNSENRILDAKINEHDLLKNLVDKMEGYPESVKFLHSKAGWLKDAPLLSDIFYVQKEYRAAVENVLEPYLNYYVVVSESSAADSIALLENRQKGKAKFFILDKMPSSGNRIESSEGLTSALDVVEFEKKYRDLAYQLLGQVVIAENQQAFEKADGVVLEKNGRMVKGKFSLSGGSIGAFEGKKIGRVKNLEKINKEIEEQKIKTNELREAIRVKEEQILQINNNLKDGQILKVQNEIIELTNLVNATINRIEAQQQMEKNSFEKLDELNDRIADTREEVADSRISLNDLLERVAEQDAVLKKNEDEFKISEENFNVVNQTYNEINLKLTRGQTRVSALEKELELRNQRYGELSEQIGINKKELEETTLQLDKTTSEINSTGTTLLALVQERETEETELNKADTQFHILRNQLAEKEDRLKQLIRDKDVIDRDVSGVKDHLNELKLQLAGMKERLMVEFRVDLEAILEEERTTSFSKEELQENNERLKKRLENIGEVNPTAVEAFTEMRKRYDFISEQKNDLVEARQSLIKTIEEVETTANQRFLDTFNKVRDNFRLVFQALFTEDDTADMVLSNPENLAETNIDIMAKPKGKRPTTINQLSGGEKTLTATALLFSIYLIKPAPFCILDEVDAPLDDSNVQKFTQMIRKFSKDSQFIIITHNKMTMASVDVIYGVTMQEPGISKLVPVDFRGLENEYEMAEEGSLVEH